MADYQGEKNLQKVALTAKEKSELFAEGIITVILLLLLNLSIMVLLQQAIVNNPQLSGGVWMIKNAIKLVRMNGIFGVGKIGLSSWWGLPMC